MCKTSPCQYGYTHNLAPMRLLLMIFLAGFIACEQGKDNAYLKEYLGDYPDIIGKTIHLDSGLVQVFPPGIKSGFPKGKKIVSFIGSSCLSCIEKIKQWTALLQKKPFDEGTAVFFIASGKTNAEFEYYLQTENKLNIPVFVDPDGSFISKNKLYKYSRATLMLNDNHEVIMVGDPLDNPRVLDYYIHLSK